MSTIRNVLVVCTGNTCRSAMAEYYLKHISKQTQLPLKIWSRGVSVAEDMGPSTKAVITLSKEGITSIKNHSTKQISKSDITDADLILVMTKAHKATLLQLIPSSLEKTVLLLSYLGYPEKDIPDPFGMKQDSYYECFASIKPALDALIKSLKKKNMAFLAGTSVKITKGIYKGCFGKIEPDKNQVLCRVELGHYRIRLTQNEKNYVVWMPKNCMTVRIQTLDNIYFFVLLNVVFLLILFLSLFQIANNKSFFDDYLRYNDSFKEGILEQTIYWWTSVDLMDNVMNVG